MKPFLPDAINQKLTTLEDALQHALESVQALWPATESQTSEPSENVISASSPDLVAETVDRIRNAAEMGDVTDLTAIAEELKLKSDSFLPLAEKIIQLAENFEFESITNFVASLEKTAKRK